MNWQDKLRGKIERLNHKLSVTETKDGLSVSHEEYGFIILLNEDDENPVQMVREILTEVSAV